MEYNVIFEITGHESLVRRVHEAIGQGWEPLGGVSIASYTESAAEAPITRIAYSQAMIRRKTQES